MQAWTQPAGWRRLVLLTAIQSFCRIQSATRWATRPRSNGVITESESDVLSGVPGARLLLFPMSGVEDCLSSLARNSTSQIKPVEVELIAVVAAQHNQTKKLAFDSNGGQQEGRGLETKAWARL